MRNLFNELADEQALSGRGSKASLLDFEREKTARRAHFSASEGTQIGR